ncbi:TetR family transcriptional regulator [Stackebrandtia endophytica]|uniref:TetR family transcriptional regulator n=1 Tax=Stackebrandtia endophytica TaxID=1496996 RepID=A0A543AY86_9ACTN|nr:TetR/AcrR family transcriptional regulator [Stackebrandtia endophytica]TQL77537.1 TetR family transcriptional regulator [Stackebrandtia endophytica]
MPDTPPAETAVRARTRGAVLDAAAHVWARDFSASLGAVAMRARVSRSTLRRYFADRQALVEALRLESERLLAAAADRAETMDSTPLETLENLIRISVEHHDRVLFLFSDPHRFPSTTEPKPDPTFIDIIERAQQEGQVDPQLRPRWIQAVFYSLVLAAAQGVTEGYLSPGQAADAAIRTLGNGIRSDG